MGLTGIGRAESARRARVREGGAIRRARVKAARTDEKPLTLDELYAISKHCCICKRFVPREQASVDHEKPLAKGGLDVPSNQRIVHRACNSAKGARTSTRKKGLRRTPLRAKPKSKIPDGVEVF